MSEGIEIVEQLNYYEVVIQNYLLPVLEGMVEDFDDFGPVPSCKDGLAAQDEALAAMEFIRGELHALQDDWRALDRYSKLYNSQLTATAMAYNELYAASSDLGFWVRIRGRCEDVRGVRG